MKLEALAAIPTDAPLAEELASDDIVEMANLELASDPLLPTITFLAASLVPAKDRAFSGETRREDRVGDRNQRCRN